MKSLYWKRAWTLFNRSTYFIAIYLLILLNSCTRIYVPEISFQKKDDIVVQNHFKDFNARNQSLYINFLNPDTKQIVQMDMDSKSPIDTLIFEGNISDYSKTYSQDFVLRIPISAFKEIVGAKLGDRSIRIERDRFQAEEVNDTIRNLTIDYFEPGLPALMHSIENYYSADGIIQTMNGIVTTRLGSDVKFYAISDFVPFIIWGGAVVTGAIITHFSTRGRSVSCEKFKVFALKYCDDDEVRKEAIDKCKFDCIENSNGKWIVGKGY